MSPLWNAFIFLLIHWIFIHRWMVYANISPEHLICVNWSMWVNLTALHGKREKSFRRICILFSGDSIKSIEISISMGLFLYLYPSWHWSYHVCYEFNIYISSCFFSFWRFFSALHEMRLLHYLSNALKNNVTQTKLIYECE